MPKQNRPLVRDGRIQVKKKRTDRSYLRPATPPAAAPSVEDFDAPVDENAAAVSPEAGAQETAAEAPPLERAIESAPPPARMASPARPAASARATGAARAIQQQGVRKRREFDVHALAVRDTRYAMHELRRILILATLVIITLIILGIVLR